MHDNGCFTDFYHLPPPLLVTIYVKKSDEKIYNALCISTPTLECLKDEVAAKYAIPKNMVAKLYKRSKKGYVTTFCILDSVEKL